MQKLLLTLLVLCFMNFIRSQRQGCINGGLAQEEDATGNCVCTEGYFGNPVNGGECRECECNGQGTQCDHTSGKCICTTKGITGDHCDRCDTQNHYFGDPIKGGCFYHLTTDYQFTFNLSKPEDKHFTAINFKNSLTKADVDVDFSITCSVPAKMKMTYQRSLQDGSTKEDIILSAEDCSFFKYKFSKDEYTIGNEEEEAAFFVYLSDFQTPFSTIISFAQQPKQSFWEHFVASIFNTFA